MSLSRVLLFDYASELARHIITLVLIIWNFRLFKQNDHLSKINMDLMALDLTETPELDVNIDFDEASVEWRRNKRYTGNGTFEYKKGIKQIIKVILLDIKNGLNKFLFQRFLKRNI